MFLLCLFLPDQFCAFAILTSVVGIPLWIEQKRFGTRMTSTLVVLYISDSFDIFCIGTVRLDIVRLPIGRPNISSCWVLKDAMFYLKSTKTYKHTESKENYVRNTSLYNSHVKFSKILIHVAFFYCVFHLI